MDALPNRPIQSNRRQFLFAIGATGLTLEALAREDRPLIRAQRTAKALGSAVSITVYHEMEARAQAALRAAFAELERVEALLSIYRPTSEVSRLNRDGVLQRPSADLLKVLRYAQTLARQTEGAFDVTVQPLWAVFAAAKKNGQLPGADAVRKAQALVNWKALEITADHIRFKQPGMAITLNGIAQGYASDRVEAVLQKAGVEHALVDTGEINSLGSKPETAGWKVGIQHPRREDAYLALAQLQGRCLATSGDYATPFSADLKAHHIFDPHTGRSPEQLASVSIAARTGMEADALSTALFVLGPARGLRLLQQTPGTDALLVNKAGATQRTQNFPLAS